MSEPNQPNLRLYNTLTRAKEVFQPIDPSNVRMYVCGPTVYDFAHIGNARPAIVFDVLFRLLRHLYGENHVTYVRNITDVDDKINARAGRDFPDLPLNEAIRKVTEKTARQYEADVAALGCLRPTHEPRATDFVLPRADGKADMAGLIQSLLDRRHAYAAGGEILFDTRSMPDYGALSRRPLDEQIAGARVAVDAHKRNPADFVLWKQSDENEPGWDARFRVGGQELAIRGRPGWHIECSAMSAAYLGEVFDIHGGGLDLIFPHHENEIAQSRCAHGSLVMSNYWLHNGFLQVEGRKMSKSEGNFITIDDLLNTERFGGRQWPGDVLRLAMLMTHYREPIDFSVKRLNEARTLLDNLLSAIEDRTVRQVDRKMDEEFTSMLSNDLDTSALISRLTTLIKGPMLKAKQIYTIYKFTKILGISVGKIRISRIVDMLDDVVSNLDLLTRDQLYNIQRMGRNRPLFKSGRLRPEYELMVLIEKVAKFAEDEKLIGGLSKVRERIPSTGKKETRAAKIIRLFDDLIKNSSKPAGSLNAELDEKIAQRILLLKQRRFDEADRIRDELLAQGIQLKDGKDPQTGERITTWEVKR